MRFSPFLASTVIAVKFIALAQGVEVEDGPLAFSHAGATNSKVVFRRSPTDETEGTKMPRMGEEPDFQLASRPAMLAPTEEELLDSRALKVNFKSKQLAKLLTEEIPIKYQSDKDKEIRTAIEEKDNRKLYILSRCPVCLLTMHSSTIAAMSCRHGVHKDCLKLTNGHCPECLSGQIEDKGRPKFLKKILKLFETKGFIPPKPKEKLFETNGVKVDPNPLVTAIKQHVALASKILDEISWAVVQTSDVAKRPKPALPAHYGDRVAGFVAERLLENRPVPHAIWGVTAFDWSLGHLTSSYISGHYKDFGLNAENYKILDQVLREFASPNYAFEAYQRLVKEYTTVYRIFSFAVRPKTRSFGLLRSWIEGISSRFQNMLDAARFWLDGLRKAPVSPKHEKSQQYYLFLKEISKEIVTDFGKILKEVKPHSSFWTGEKKLNWVNMLLALRVLVFSVADTTLASGSHLMKLFERHSDLILACLSRGLGNYDRMQLKSDDGTTMSVDVVHIREMAQYLNNGVSTHVVSKAKPKQSVMRAIKNKLF